MHISKLICIPLCIIIPVIILIFESKNRDFITPPDPIVLQQRIDLWESNNPILNPPVPLAPLPPKKEPRVITPAIDPNIAIVKPHKTEPTLPTGSAVEPFPHEALLGFLNTSPDLDYLKQLNKTQLLALISQLKSQITNPPQPDITQLIYLANERIIDSSDASIADINQAANQLGKLQVPLWNPDPTSAVPPLYIHLQLEPYHYKKAKALVSQIEATIQAASGGTVHPKVLLTKVPQVPNQNNNQITLSAKKSASETDAALRLNSIPNTEWMIASALKNIVTLNVNTKQLPLKNTDKVHYKNLTRHTWKTLAEALEK